MIPIVKLPSNSMSRDLQLASILTYCSQREMFPRAKLECHCKEGHTGSKIEGRSLKERWGPQGDRE